MTSPVTTRELLFHELSVLVRTTRQLLSKIDGDHWTFRPHPSMRTLHELAEHLVQIPAVDLAILQEKDQRSVQQLEAELSSDNKEGLIAVLETGQQQLREYMESLDEQSFFEKRTTAFYAQESSTQAKWLLEIVTHMAHHRSQLFNYLKQLDYNVNMFDLY
ncbi:DinB family protein [Paenactinomyces guangxiensis]|uniref:DinB family protein n=1 Tax=Paenactinomyces guangxiensis TaxID=1490290 RepID=A0A7W1WPX2_9BACL|nr:DinB family protein [Paenactinomyces guangxiensis]MBA4493860.1 DinB family protein [Paenactinomyces guangxiensis]MBH8591326.1 DinB family protein [Paenactinomyces guangxiensis]